MREHWFDSWAVVPTPGTREPMTFRAVRGFHVWNGYGTSTYVRILPVALTTFMTDTQRLETREVARG